MDFDADFNLVINKIVAKQGVSTMVVAKDGSGKGPFLTALSNYYKKVFWFSPLADDFGNLVLCIAQRIFESDKDKLNKVKQVLYCKNRFNNDDVVINYIFDYISRDKCNYMFTFEEMDVLSKNYDFSQIERMIKLCPDNLKIVVSSERFIPVDFSCFGNRWPTIIDEKIIHDKSNAAAIGVYMNMIDTSERIFLKTFGRARIICAEFAESLFPGAKKILDTLAGYPSMVSKRGDGFYKMTSGFKKYIADELRVQPEFKEEELGSRYVEYCVRHRDYRQAIKAVYEFDDVAGLDGVLKLALTDKLDLDTLIKIARYYPPLHRDVAPEDYPYYSVYLALSEYVGGNGDRAIEIIRRVEQAVGESDPVYLVAISLELYILYKQKRYEAERDRYEQLSDYIGDKPVIETEDIISTNIKSMIEADMPINMTLLSRYEQIFDVDRDAIYYVKMKELFSRAYAHIGNYKKAIEIVEGLHNAIPFYTVPHNTVGLRFFGIDGISEVEEEIDKALANAEAKDIRTDKSLLYAAKGRVNEYFGKADEAIALYEKAVDTPFSSNRAKFQNVADLTVAYARYRSLEYAKEYARVYLKYAESFFPTYTYLLHYALAYCCFLEGDVKTAHDHAVDCVRQSKSKSRYWLLCMAVTANELIKKNAMGNPVEFVEKLLKTAESFGMDMMIVENYDIFDVIVGFAINNGIMKDYTDRILSEIEKKDQARVRQTEVKINIIGNASVVFVNGKEVSWKTRKSKDLFIHYMLAGKEGLDRSYIIDLFWGDYQYESAINNMKTTNNILRKTLEGVGVEYKLEYLNSKYVLYVKGCSIDAQEMAALVDEALKEPNLRRKVALTEKILSEYKGDIGHGMKQYQMVEDLKRDIRRNEIILLIRVIKALIRDNECIEARRFLDALMELDAEGDYSAFKQEINFRMGVL